MVAGTINSYILVFWRANFLHQRFGIGSIYLYVILMSREKSLETIIVLVLASLIIYLLSDVSWLVYVAVCLLIFSLVSRKITTFIAKGWLFFAHYFGMVMNYLILIIIYYVILFPLAMLQRLLGKNQILKQNTTDSYFKKREHLFSQKDIDHLW